MTRPDATPLEDIPTEDEIDEHIRKEEARGERRRWDEKNTVTGFEMERRMRLMNQVENATEDVEQTNIDDFGDKLVQGDGLAADEGR